MVKGILKVTFLFPFPFSRAPDKIQQGLQTETEFSASVSLDVWNTFPGHLAWKIIYTNNEQSTPKKQAMSK